MFRKIFMVCFLLLMSVTASAQSVSINVKDYYLINFGPNTLIGGNTVYNDVNVRVAAGSGVVGAFRLQFGLSTLPIGTVVTITWADGTSEKYVVLGTTGTVQAGPLVGTQKDKDGNFVDTCSDGGCTERPIDGGGSNEGNGGNWIQNAWNRLLEYLSRKDRDIRIIVGPIEQ
jgi:hypothetical protein